MAVAKIRTMIRKGRYADSATMDDVKQYTTQWLNTVEVGHGNIGAGGLAEAENPGGYGLSGKGYEQRNTGVFLSAMQQFNSVTLEAAARNDDNSNFGNHATADQRRMGVHRGVSHHRFLRYSV